MCPKQNMIQMIGNMILIYLQHHHKDANFKVKMSKHIVSHLTLGQSFISAGSTSLKNLTKPNQSLGKTIHLPGFELPSVLSQYTYTS